MHKFITDEKGLRVRRKEIDTAKGKMTIYETSLSAKNTFNGKTRYLHLSLHFPKDTDIKDDTYVKINNGFLTFFGSKLNDGEYTVPSSSMYVMITDYEILDGNKKPKYTYKPKPSKQLSEERFFL